MNTVFTVVLAGLVLASCGTETDCATDAGELRRVGKWLLHEIETEEVYKSTVHTRRWNIWFDKEGPEPNAALADLTDSQLHELEWKSRDYLRALRAVLVRVNTRLVELGRRPVVPPSRHSSY